MLILLRTCNICGIMENLLEDKVFLIFKTVENITKCRWSLEVNCLMLKMLTSVKEYMNFINEINSDPNFGDPMLRTQEQIKGNLLDAPQKPNHQVWGIFDGEEMAGLFVFLILEEESYLEMIVGLSRNQKAYEEVLSFLKRTYSGCQVDFVYNPGNYLLHRLLQNEKSEFETEQLKMVLKKDVSHKSDHQIELYSPKYKEQYIAIHQNDGYWTAEKVIDALDRFRIILAIEDEKVVGYMDITHKFEENEPYDIFVKKECRRKGYGKAMLARAIELNKPKSMMLLTDIDDMAAIALYESMGFCKAAGENNITAHVML